MRKGPLVAAYLGANSCLEPTPRSDGALLVRAGEKGFVCMQKGVIRARDYEEGKRETQLLLSHLGAFVMGITFLAIGIVL